MIESGPEYKDLLKKLKKDEIIKIIKDYNILADLFNDVTLDNLKAKKDLLIKEIDEVKENYFKYFVMSLDEEDLEVLKELITKKCDTEFLNCHKEFVNYLVDKRILWQEDNLVFPSDVLDILKKITKNKDVESYILAMDKTYKLADGIIVAYGVVDRAKFNELLGSTGDIDLVISKLEYYYKKEYKINDKMVVSNKLSNKKKIDKYYKNDNYQKFKIKDFVALGNSNYHHSIKSYKKFIKILKNYYVFKKSDILFVDKNIVIPYLYNSLNEEEVANKNLEETVVSLFEFKGDKLKQKMLKEIMAIRDDFPLWEYRGFTKASVEK